ncbi:hypothetical protein [Flavobacterium panacagri]|uniref:hypothetical protein n=1 Tax=Flavobacterium panacagri TaxID=3034146 RepID=UPI0025A66750|nr:hypothetical protein [Flavobacterium panacagri]
MKETVKIQSDEIQSSAAGYNINKALKLNRVEQGESTDNVLVHSTENEVKFIARNELVGGSQNFQEVVSKSADNADGLAVASLEDPSDVSKKASFSVGKTDDENMGAVISSSASASTASYITENGKIKAVQSNTDGTLKTELKMQEPTVLASVYVPAPTVAGDYVLATTQDVTLDKAADAGAIITDKTVEFLSTESDSKTSIDSQNISVLGYGFTGGRSSSPPESKIVIDKKSVWISEKVPFGNEGGEADRTENDEDQEFVGYQQNDIYFDKFDIAIYNEVAYGPDYSEYNSIGMNGSEWNFYARQGNNGFRATPFSFGFSEGEHNVSFMLDSPINQTTQIRFNPLGGTVAYENSFKTINGKSILGSGDLVIGGSSAASNLQDVLNTGKVSTTTGQNIHFQLRSQFYDGGPYHDMIFKRNSIRAEFDNGGYVFDENGIYSIRDLYSAGFGYQGFSLTSNGLYLKTNPIGGNAIIKSDNLSTNTILQLPGTIEVNGVLTLASTKDIEAYVGSRTVNSSTTTPLTSATLNETYPAATAGFRVMALNIPSDKVIYEKTAAGWIKTSVSFV